MERNIKTFVLFCLLIRVPLLCDILPEKRKLDRLISTRSTCSTSKSCPPQRNYELWHSHCKHSCLDDERYICLENEDGEPITEFCAPASLKCEPGTKGVFTIDNNDHTKVVMTVTPCPQDKYQQHSSNCTNACKGNRGDFTGLPEGFVIYSNGSSVEPPKVYCNYTAGYYSPDNSFLFPYDDSFIHYYGPYCRHVNDSDPCSKGMMPLPNGSCIEPCIVGYVRDDHDNFICKPLSINPVSVDGKYLTTQPTTVFQSTTERNKNLSWTSRNISVIIVVIIIVLAIIGSLIIILCCLWCKRKNRYEDKNRKNIEEEIPLHGIAAGVEVEPPADKSEEEIAFINEANGKIANGTGALQKKEGTMANGTDALPKEGTMVNGTDALPKEGTMVNGTDDLPKEGTMVNGTDALPNKEGTMVNGTDALPKKEGTMPNGTNALPKKEGTRANEEITIELEPRHEKAGELKKTYDDTITQSMMNALNTQPESVGSLICRGDIAGTVFRVGTNYVMTALHVVYVIIKKDKKGLDEDYNLDWSQLTSDEVYVSFNESAISSQIKVLQVTCVYLNKLFDVAVLKFVDVLNYPRRMVLDTSTHLNPEKVSVIGFGHPNNILKKHIDPSCEVILPGSMKIISAHAWLQGEGKQYRNKMNSKHHDLGYQGYDDQHKIILSCYLEHGASGAPIIAQDYDRTMKVVGMLTNGLPDFFFELSKGEQESFPCEYRFEYGTLMRYVYKDMLGKNKNLAEDIFGASGEAQYQVEGPIHIVPG